MTDQYILRVERMLKKKKKLLFCNLAFVLTFELFHVKEYYTNHEIISNSSHVWCQ